MRSLATFATLPFLLASCGDVRTVSAVVDGNTLRLDGDATPLRLLGAHAPKLSQPRGVDAAVLLCRLVCGKQVRVHVEGKARDGVTLASVSVDGVDVGAELVKSGAAWARGSRYSDDMHEAQRQGAGVWTDAASVAPWLWVDSPSSLPRRRSE